MGDFKVRMSVTTATLLLLLQGSQLVTSRPPGSVEGPESSGLSKDYYVLQNILGKHLGATSTENSRVIDLLLQLLEEIDLPTLCEVIVNDTKTSNHVFSRVPIKYTDIDVDLLNSLDSQMTPENSNKEATLQTLSNMAVDADKTTSAESHEQMAVKYNDEESNDSQNGAKDTDHTPASYKSHTTELQNGDCMSSQEGQNSKDDSSNNVNYREVLPSSILSSGDSKEILNNDLSGQDLLHDGHILYSNLLQDKTTPANGEGSPEKSIGDLKQMYLRSQNKQDVDDNEVLSGYTNDINNKNVLVKQIDVEKPRAQLFSQSLVLGDWMNKNRFDRNFLTTYTDSEAEIKAIDTPSYDNNMVSGDVWTDHAKSDYKTVFHPIKQQQQKYAQGYLDSQDIVGQMFTPELTTPPSTFSATDASFSTTTSEIQHHDGDLEEFRSTLTVKKVNKSISPVDKDMDTSYKYNMASIDMFPQVNTKSANVESENSITDSDSNEAATDKQQIKLLPDYSTIQEITNNNAMNKIESNSFAQEKTNWIDASQIIPESSAADNSDELPNGEQGVTVDFKTQTPAQSYIATTPTLYLATEPQVQPLPLETDNETVYASSTPITNNTNEMVTQATAIFSTTIDAEILTGKNGTTQPTPSTVQEQTVTETAVQSSRNFGFQQHTPASNLPQWAQNLNPDSSDRTRELNVVREVTELANLNESVLLNNDLVKEGNSTVFPDSHTDQSSVAYTENVSTTADFPQMEALMKAAKPSAISSNFFAAINVTQDRETGDNNATQAWGHNDVMQAGVASSEVTQARVTSSFIAQAGVSNSEVTHVMVTNSDALHTEVSNSGVTNKGVTQTGVSNNRVTQAGVTNNDVTQTAVNNNEVTQTEVTNNGVTQTGVSNSTVTQAGVTNNDVTQTEVNNNEVTNNGVTQTGVSNNGVTQAGVTNSYVTQTEVSNNEVTQAGVTNSDVIQTGTNNNGSTKANVTNNNVNNNAVTNNQTTPMEFTNAVTQQSSEFDVTTDRIQHTNPVTTSQASDLLSTQITNTTNDVSEDVNTSEATTAITSDTLHTTNRIAIKQASALQEEEVQSKTMSIVNVKDTTRSISSNSESDNGDLSLNMKNHTSVSLSAYSNILGGEETSQNILLDSTNTTESSIQEDANNVSATAVYKAGKHIALNMTTESDVNTNNNTETNISNSAKVTSLFTPSHPPLTTAPVSNILEPEQEINPLVMEVNASFNIVNVSDNVQSSQRVMSMSLENTTFVQVLNESLGSANTKADAINTTAETRNTTAEYINTTAEAINTTVEYMNTTAEAINTTAEAINATANTTSEDINTTANTSEAINATANTTSEAINTTTNTTVENINTIAITTAEDINKTSEAINATAEAINTAAEAINAPANTASEDINTTAEAINTTAEAINAPANTTSEDINTTANTSEAINATANATVENINTIAITTAEAINTTAEAINTTAEAINTTANTTSEATNATANTASETINATANTTVENINTIADTTSEAINTTAEAINTTAEAINATANATSEAIYATANTTAEDINTSITVTPAAVTSEFSAFTQTNITRPGVNKNILATTENITVDSSENNFLVAPRFVLEKKADFDNFIKPTIIDYKSHGLIGSVLELSLEQQSSETSSEEATPRTSSVTVQDDTQVTDAKGTNYEVTETYNFTDRESNTRSPASQATISFLAMGVNKSETKKDNADVIKTVALGPPLNTDSLSRLLRGNITTDNLKKISAKIAETKANLSRINMGLLKPLQVRIPYEGSTSEAPISTEATSIIEDRNMSQAKSEVTEQQATYTAESTSMVSTGVSNDTTATLVITTAVNPTEYTTTEPTTSIPTVADTASSSEVNTAASELPVSSDKAILATITVPFDIVNETSTPSSTSSSYKQEDLKDFTQNMLDGHSGTFEYSNIPNSESLSGRDETQVSSTSVPKPGNWAKVYDFPYLPLKEKYPNKPRNHPYMSQLTDHIDMQKLRTNPVLDSWKVYNIAVGKSKTKVNNQGTIDQYSAPEIHLYSSHRYTPAPAENLLRNYLWQARPWPKDALYNLGQDSTYNTMLASKPELYQNQQMDMSKSVNYQTKTHNKVDNFQDQLKKIENANIWGNRFNQGYYGRVFDDQSNELNTDDSTTWPAIHSREMVNFDKLADNIKYFKGYSPAEGIRNKYNHLNGNLGTKSSRSFDLNQRYRDLMKTFPLNRNPELKEQHMNVEPDHSGSQPEYSGAWRDDSSINVGPTETAALPEAQETGFWTTDTPSYNGVPAPEDYTCPGLFGYHKDPKNCQAFFICSWGMAHRVVCPPGTLYNSKEAVCDWAVNIRCTVTPDNSKSPNV